MEIGILGKGRRRAEVDGNFSETIDKNNLNNKRQKLNSEILKLKHILATPYGKQPK